MTSAKALVLGGMMAIFSGAPASSQTHKGHEMPPYVVELADGAVEVRQYGAHLVAEVTVAGTRDDSIGTGFRTLAGYIFGGNATGQKIAMTVPVTQTPGAAGRWTIRFMMPAAFGADTLPAPRDGGIRLVEVGPERQVVLGFSGLRSDQALTRREAELRAWAAERGLALGAGPHFYFYDGPMTLPWARRNEVAFTLD